MKMFRCHVTGQRGTRHPCLCCWDLLIPSSAHGLPGCGCSSRVDGVTMVGATQPILHTH